MIDLAAFYREAVAALIGAVEALGQREGLYRAPQTLLKSARRRCLNQLRLFALILRRLIFLMALSVELAPVAPREGRNYFDAEDTASRPRWRGLRLVPSVSGAFPELLRSLPGVFSPGPADAAPVIERWGQLFYALHHRERRARRLARTLQRWQAAGEGRPAVRPLEGVHRLTPRLGLIAGAVTARLDMALGVWPDTG
ncbi:MAG: hypothetical protein R3C13_11810 [Hyphomonas sp.]|uniref:hypothetical protein n=1 Tax=Hyphomonas sp. TaxID=87 RepID=UPI003526D5F8